MLKRRYSYDDDDTTSEDLEYPDKLPMKGRAITRNGTRSEEDYNFIVDFKKEIKEISHHVLRHFISSIALTKYHTAMKLLEEIYSEQLDSSQPKILSTLDRFFPYLQTAKTFITRYNYWAFDSFHENIQHFNQTRKMWTAGTAFFRIFRRSVYRKQVSFGERDSSF
ncbi:hypothetical protein PHYBLDRAFT_162028 [Phycomyces blakesleeanus NRRL 1555(-)]|uniref:Uncharacterized protein n=1 Tax=Phycomyces blakesleeanus (strain ATCC 8743b / DSM 1359 / FGSC 10004 / NBRC 33097 / NRRL 1555) TaxID=763407 RepID=A0A167RDJ7_PHYB8|nr:hypothetical protein PHYBLDRAFT_162028 [Phycomyces blakesleeanus NRRL 1555(-)]OAD81414.1 hypothetical protein PHYBLDRAFT_162028 [Phycomyces blakesleeanus NRRL 1555(-)]|eukprot:XP_018299454.1 hypothetical protein PHYBLDRAFT_162028 [Phycomyces blakesleeanus NRRL 1555(-)]